MSSLSLLSVAARRLWNYRLIMLCLLAGIIAAVSLLASVPLYADAVHNRLLQGELTETGTRRPPFAFLWRYVGAWNGDVSWADYLPIDEYLTQQSAAIINLPLDQLVRHVSTTKLRLYAADTANFNSGDPLLWAGVGFISNLEDHINLVEGTFPNESSAALQVIVSQTTAEQLGLQVGENYVLFTPGQDGRQIPVQISGIWQPADPTDPFWFYQPAAFNETLLTNEAAFAAQVAARITDPVSTAVWYQVFDGRRIRPGSVGRLLDNVATVTARATALLNNTTLDTSPVAALTDYGRAARLLTLILTIFSLPVIGLVLYFMSLVAGMVVQRGQTEIAVLRSRGATRRQIMALYLLEGGLLALMGLAAGLWLAGRLAQLMGRGRTFLDPALFTSSSEPLVTVLSTTAVSYALLAVLLALLALLLPAFASTGYTIVTLRWQQARALLAPFWQRYFLDVFLLIPPLYGWYQLDKQGTLSFGLGSGGDPFANPLLFLVPILFCFSLGLCLVRLFPWLMGGLAWLAGWLPGTTLLLVIRQLARSARQYTGPLLLLCLTLSLATFTASMAVTLDDHLYESIYYQIGADLNLAELGENTEEPDSPTLPGQEQFDTEEEDEDEPQWLFLPVTDHLTVPGVEAAARVGDYDVTTNLGGRQQTGRILGIDRVDFTAVAYYRPDFAGNESLGGLMNRLAAGRDYILVSRAWMEQNGLQVGDPLRLNVGAAGDFADIEFTIAGPLDLFPTLYPQDGPFFVANLDYIHEGLGGTYPYNVWLATDANTNSQSIVDGVRDLGLAVSTTSDARTTIAAEQTRPERQGLFGLLSAGFLASAVLTVLGFLVHTVVSFRRRAVELGMLRAVGLSVSQMAAFLAGEQAALILAGTGLGTGLGLLASILFIPFFQVGGDKTAQIPPFAVQIAWQPLATIYALFGVMFIVAVLALAILLIRMRLFEAVKLGEAV